MTIDHTAQEETMSVLTLYGQPGCAPCKLVSRKLDAEDIDYSYRDVTEDAAAREHIQQLGHQQTPVIETPTDHFSGLDPDRLSAAIDESRAAMAASTTAPSMAGPSVA